MCGTGISYKTNYLTYSSNMPPFRIAYECTYSALVKWFEYYIVYIVFSLSSQDIFICRKRMLCTYHLDAEYQITIITIIIIIMIIIIIIIIIIRYVYTCTCMGKLM